MITYSTCSDCHGPLIVTDERAYQRGLRHHDGEPPCRPARPSELDWLCAQYLKAIEAGDSKLEAELAERIWGLQHRPPKLLDAALAYAGWGWPVFPLYPRGSVHPYTRKECTGKTPASRHGVLDATTNIEHIRRYWSANPDHNIGLATGLHFDVIDVDRAGIEQYHQWIDEAAATRDNVGILPDCHGKVITANAGYHLYVRPSGRGNAASRHAPGIDYRGKGGYVVAPPSTLGEPGKAWGWLIYPSPLIRGK